MSVYATVLLADSPAVGRIAVRERRLNRSSTLVVSAPEDLTNRALRADVRVVDVTERMSLRRYKAIAGQLRIARDWTEPSPDVVAAELVDAVARAQRPAQHSWTPDHLRVRAMLTELLAVEGTINRDFLQQVADAVTAELPENAAKPAASVAASVVTNQVTGPVSGPLAQIGVVHGGIHPALASEAVMRALQAGVTRVSIS